MARNSLQWWTLFLISAASLAAPAMAQSDSSEHVAVTVYPARTAIAPGDTLRVAIILDHDQHWHTQAHETPDPDLYIPTTVDARTTGALQAHANLAVWPEPEMVEFGFDPGNPLPVYQDRTIIYLPVVAPYDVKPGSSSLTVSVKFQACDDDSCLAPATVSKSLEIAVVPRGQEQAASDADQTIFAGFPEEVWTKIDRGQAEAESTPSFNLVWIIVLAGVVLIIVAIVGAKLALGR